MSPAARAYLTQALDLLQQNSIDAANVDWPALRTEAFGLATQAQTTEQTYSAIFRAVALLRNRHTRFLTPAAAADLSSPSASPDGPPTGELLPGGYARVTVPRMSGDDKAVASYVQGGIEAVRQLDRSRPCGWIIDLRRNVGGNMWPMLTVLAPLLDGPTLGYFVDAAGNRTPWTLRDGQPRIADAAPEPQRNTLRLARPRPAVAVLTGPATASAGEATLIAFHGQPNTRTFGQPTAGVPSANQLFPLSDGAELLITTANDADRTGHVYPNLVPVPPDQFVPDGPAGSDPTSAAAVRWLAGTTGCRR